MLHVYSMGAYVASINKNNPIADSFDPANPWLLLHKSGRVDRFHSLSAARDDARKIGPNVTFSKV
jgi:hypothetical protein